MDDFKFAEEQAAKVNPKVNPNCILYLQPEWSKRENCILYLQPEWSKREKITPFIVDYVMKHPKWKVSLQTHKYLNIP